MPFLLPNRVKALKATRTTWASQYQNGKHILDFIREEKEELTDCVSVCRYKILCSNCEMTYVGE